MRETMREKSSLEVSRRVFWLALLLAGAFAVRAQAPYSATQPAGPVSRTNATLNGMATARGSATMAWFEWGPEASYGFTTAQTNVGTSARVARVSMPITDLTPGAVYHYRLVASNGFGTTYGADARLATGMKLSTWEADISRFFYHPNILAGLTSVVSQASGHYHSLALTTEGRVLAWGVGIPLFDYKSSSTNVPSDLTNVVMVAGGYSHSLAVRQDGTVAFWGEYLFGSTSSIPASVTNVIAVAGGDSFSLALKGDGTVVAWGPHGVSPPKSVTNVVAITAGSDYGYALKADGTVVAWGSGIGAGTPPAFVTNVVAISSEVWHTLALRSNGTVVAWGNDTYGNTVVPAGLSNVVAIAAGYWSSLALKADGTLVSWGYSGYVTNVPISLSNVVAISSGDHHSLASSPENLAPVVYDRLYTGGLNKDLIVNLYAWDPNGDPLALRITSIPTNGTLYQYSGGVRGAAITSPNTVISDVSRVVFAPAPNAWGAQYVTFSFIANDGMDDSGSGMATVAILPQPAIVSAGFVPGANGGYAIYVQGISNLSYSVWSSTDLTKWTIVNYCSEISPGLYYLLDTGATNRPLRFYRARSP